MLARLMQHDAGQVQRASVSRICLQDRVVAQERFAEFALLMQMQRAIEFGVDAHEIADPAVERCSLIEWFVTANGERADARRNAYDRAHFISLLMMIDRRALLKMLVSVPFATARLPAAAAVATDATFDRASQALTGYPVPSADDAKAMSAAFVTPERRAALGRLARLVADTPPDRLDAALRDSGMEQVANDLVAAWYSGIVTNGKQQRLVLYTDAYVWSAMTFTKPMGICGGVTGYWKDPPA